MGQPSYVPLYFAPDADPSWAVNPGVCVDVRNMVPTTRGTLVNYCCTPSETYETVAPYTGLSAGDGPVGARIMRRINGTGSGTSRFFIGTTEKLLEVGTTTITDVSRAIGGVYAGSEWTFASFGDTMIACEVTGGVPVSVPQLSTGVLGTLFAAATGSPPRAQLCVVQKNMLLVANVGDGATTFGDGWMCSGLGNIASWTTIGGVANLATQANNGRLLEANGDITALVAMRDFVVAYKRDAIFIGQYSGNPFGWSWRMISDKVGQFGPNGTAVVNGVHYFLHTSGVYAFDGSSPQNIGTGVVNRFLSSRFGSEFDWDWPIRAVVDERNSLIYWFFRTQDGRDYTSIPVSGGTLGFGYLGLCYNYVSQKFGLVGQPWSDQIGGVFDGGQGIPVVASRGELRSWALNATQLIRPEVASIWTVGNLSDNLLIRHAKIGDETDDVTNTTSTIITGDIGNEVDMTRVSRIKPALVLGDDNLQSSSCSVDSKASKGDYYTGLGMMINATATSAGSGAAYGATIRTDVSANPHTIAASDYLAFDLLPIAGNLTTPVGIRLTFSDATTFDATVNPTALGSSQSVLILLSSVAGKILGSTGGNGLRPMFGVPAATGLHSAIMRRFRIADVNGVLRRRLGVGNETRFQYSQTAPTNYSGVTSYPQESLGAAFTYDVARRRWDGQKTDRWHRIRMDFANQVELSGVYLTTDKAGSE